MMEQLSTGAIINRLTSPPIGTGGTTLLSTHGFLLKTQAADRVLPKTPKETQEDDRVEVAVVVGVVVEDVVVVNAVIAFLYVAMQ